MATTFMVQDGDIIVSSSTGRPILVSGVAKLQQDLDEFFNIDVQPNGFGAGLDRLVGLVPYGGDALVTSMAEQQITDGLADFRRLQRSNSTIPRTSDERIVGAKYIQVQQDNNDQTKFYFVVNVVTESGKVVSSTTTIGD